MIIMNDELLTLSDELWEWIRTGRPIDEAPDKIKRKVERYKELHLQLKNEELRMMGE